MKELIGKDVFIIKNNEIEKGKIVSIVITAKSIKYWYTREKYYGEWFFCEESIGETVFFSQKEAKQKLSK